MKRFWVFNSAEWEPSLGLLDLVGSCATKEAAAALVKKGEWGAVFDSKTKKQYSYSQDEPIIDIVENFK